MSYGPLETHKAIYQVLSQDTELQTLLGGTGRVFDIAPQSQAFPFVNMGDFEWSDRANHTMDGYEGNLTVKVFYRSPNQGRKEVQKIQGRIDQLLNGMDPIITGWEIVTLRRGTVSILTDEDGVTLYGVQTFKIMIGEIK